MIQKKLCVRLIKKKNKSGYKKGFTLIEILVVIGIIAVLAAVVLVAVNPARQFKLARDSQRTSNITALLNAIGQNIAEHKGVFVCNGTAMNFPPATTTIKNDGSGGGTDIASCLVPDYISALPYDPLTSKGTKYASPTDYNTGYGVFEDEHGRITVTADGELAQVLSVTR